MSDQGLTRRSVLRGTALGILGAALPATETLTASPARADAAPLTLTVNAAQPGHAVSPDLFGAFFEEINYAGVGGIYAELIRNRAFMDPAIPAHWVAPADIPRVPGNFGSAVQLSGGSPANYVQLPQDIVAGLTDFTVAAWVNPAAVPNWARVFDFGTGETAYMFMTVSAGGTNNPRYAITISGNGNEQRLDAPGPLPLNQSVLLAS